ncbi:MAG: hypothetical protein IPJ77_05965 [Planctomycetes bacterium]|nr:hypothetical protein [Planctomycetota bacterium]
MPTRSATLVIEHVLVTRERGPNGKTVRTRRVIGRLEAQLWLQRAFRGETVWACNPEHLAELESLIGAKLRERSRNPGAGNRLPAWLLASKNRADLVKVLDWLRRRVHEGAAPKRGAPKSGSTARSVRRARGSAPLVELA